MLASSKKIETQADLVIRGLKPSKQRSLVICGFGIRIRDVTPANN